MKKNYILLLILMCISIKSFDVLAKAIPEVVIQGLMNQFDKDFEEKEYYSLDTLVDLTKSSNFEIRTSYEKVYQAKKDIRVRLGRIIPNLNFNGAYALTQAGTALVRRNSSNNNSSTNGVSAIIQDKYIPVISNLFGFLFPSYWMNWKQSKDLYWAQKKSHIALMADQINIIESLAIDIHLEKQSILLYQDFFVQIKELLDIAKARAYRGENTKDLIMQLEDVFYKISNDYILLITNLNQNYSDLAKAVGLSPSTWNRFALEALLIPDISNAQEEESKNFRSSVLENSFELKSFQYLIKASRHNFGIRTIEFLDPGTSDDGSFGAGFVGSLKIGRSQTKRLKVRYSEMKVQLLSTLDKSIANYNIAIKMYKNNWRGLRNAQERYDFLKEKFIQTGVYNSNNFSEAISSLFKFKSLIIESQFKFLNAKSKIDRLTMSPPYYENLHTFIP